MDKLSLKATAIGSLPYKNPQAAIDMIFDKFSDIPFWPQLGALDRREDMTVQYIQGIPGIVYDEIKEKYIFNTTSDEFFVALEEFFMDYESIVNEKDFSKLEKYAITPPYSSAIDLFFEKLKNKNYKFAKGQVIGAFTWGTSICDGDLQCSFYDETCREILIKAVTLKAVWQIQKMKEINPDITPIIFFDEPVMSQYGTSAFVTVKRDELVDAFSEVVKVVKDFGALSAIHCCGKSDWSVLIDSGVDIINLDAYFFAKSLVPYAKKIEKFLKTGGYIAWGIVPTLDADALSQITLEKLVEIYEDALNALEEKGLARDLVIDRSIFTPSCGAGSLSMELADKAMSLVNNLSNQLSTGGLLCR